MIKLILAFGLLGVLAACAGSGEVAPDDNSASLEAEVGNAIERGVASELGFQDLCDSFALQEGIDAMFFVDSDGFADSLDRLVALLELDPSLSYEVTTPDEALAELAAIVGIEPEEYALLLDTSADGIIEVTSDEGEAPGREDPIVAAVLADPAVFAHALASDAVGDPPPTDACF